MAKVTIGEFTYEGTPKELKEIFETMGGVKFPEVAEEKFEVGDYVKVVGRGKYGGQYDIGSIGQITTGYYNERDNDFKVVFIHSEDHDYFFADDIVKATDEEVTEVKEEVERKHVEEKWAKIGRKPNELKEGDFVKYAKCYAEITRVGLYDISILVPNGDIIAVPFVAVDLIAPVETRFDKDSE